MTQWGHYIVYHIESPSQGDGFAIHNLEGEKRNDDIQIVSKKTTGYLVVDKWRHGMLWPLYN